MTTPADTVREHLVDTGVTFDESSPGVFAVELPGERKLTTACSLAVGDHSLTVNAFVARRPDENAVGVYRWLLERNARIHVERLAGTIGSRPPGTEAHARARAYIIDQLKIFGYQVRVQETDAGRP